MSQNIVVLSGKKQAGKNTACNFIVSEYIKERYNIYSFVNEKGHLVWNDTEIEQVTDQFITYGIKVYSFADELKRICIDVLNVPRESCYGSDEEKNKPIPHLLWKNFPLELRLNTNRENVSGRELMQILGTNFFRKIYGDCWALSTFRNIQKEKYKLSLICDCRFPNEILMSKQFNAKTIRLNRTVYNDNHDSEIALDNFPIEQYDLYVNNQNIDIPSTLEIINKNIKQMNWIL